MKFGMKASIVTRMEHETLGLDRCRRWRHFDRFLAVFSSTDKTVRDIEKVMRVDPPKTIPKTLIQKLLLNIGVTVSGS